MISIIKIIISIFYRPKILQFWRAPAYKSFRAHFLGLTLAFVFLVWMQCDTLLVHDIPDSNLQTTQQLTRAQYDFLYGVVIIIWFAMVTYYFGIWALLTAILFLVLVIFIPLREHTLLKVFRISTLWYLGGYLGGVVLATLYNDILYLYIKIFRRRECRLIFAYDRTRTTNIIKSSLPHEEAAFEATGLSPEDRLYHFRIPPQSGTYTIAFVANPFLCVDPNKKDPIIKDLDMFLRCVAQGIQALAANEVLGRPEIWSRVRIITVFNKNYATFVESYESQSAETEENDPTNANEGENRDYNGEIFDGIVVPSNTGISTEIQNLPNADVYYFMTAMPNYLRSSAQFTVDDTAEPTSINFGEGTEEPQEIQPNSDYENPTPGKIALNVLGARQKTYIHEFAHAMSAANVRAIFDEYFNEGILEGDPALGLPTMPAINRLKRSAGGSIPHIYGTFRENVYCSDREHPSIEENWTGFYPERIDQNLSCTMDRTYGPFHFDRLICDYMYDRLIAKMR